MTVAKGENPLMRKLQALLNLANNAGSEGEAMAAMKRLTEIAGEAGFPPWPRQLASTRRIRRATGNHRGSGGAGG